MRPRLSIVTLGVRDLAASRAFYTALGWTPVEEEDDIIFFDLGGVSVLEEAPDAVWVKGGFPRVHWGRPRPKPAEWYPAYLRACLEQDLPQIGVRISSVIRPLPWVGSVSR